MPRSYYYFLLILLAVFTPAYHGQGQGKSNPTTDAAIAATVAATPGFSGAVYYRHEGEENFLYFGEDGKGQQIGPSTNFAIASLSKHITSYLVIDLIQQGKVMFNTKLQDIFSLQTADVNVRNVTVEQLMNHTSGFDQQYCTVEDDINDMLACAQLEPEKIRQFHYSNFGYLLLGKIIEKITGKPFQQVFMDRIITPLNLQGSGYQRNEHTALGTIPTPIGTQLTDEFWHYSKAYNPEAIADGGMVFTIPDYVAWLKYLINDPSNEDYHFKLKRSRFYRAGWQVVQALDTSYEWHNGALLGFRSVTYWNSSTTMVIFQNNDSDSGIDIDVALLGAAVGRCKDAESCLALLNEQNTDPADPIWQGLHALAKPWLCGLVLLVLFGFSILRAKHRTILILGALSGIVCALMFSAMRMNYTLTFAVGIPLAAMLWWKWPRTGHERGRFFILSMFFQIVVLLLLLWSVIDLWLGWS